MPILSLLLHGLFWTAGAAILRVTHADGGARRRSVPDWISAYLLGLTVNNALVFTANQLAGWPITPTLLLGSALLTNLAPLGVHARQPGLRGPGSSSAARPVPLGAAMLLVAGAALFAIRQGELIWSPLVDWDSHFYHLRFGHEIAAGGFPSDIGPSVNLAAEAAYPPLFFFLYGVNALGGGLLYAAPKIVFLLTTAGALLLTGCLATQRFRLSSAAAAGAVWIATATLFYTRRLDTVPYLQAFTTCCFLAALYYTLPLFRGTRRVRDEPGQAAVAGILWAACYGSNYLGLLLIGSVAAALVATEAGARRRGARPLCRDPRNLVVLVGVLAVVVLPHPLRNLLATGNPLFPAFLDSLGGAGVSAWWLEHANTLAPRPLSLATLRLAIAENPPVVAFVLGATMSGLGMSAALDRRSGLLPRWMSLACLCVVGLWLSSLQLPNAPSWRYLVPLLPLCACLLARAFERAWTGRALRDALPVLLGAATTVGAAASSRLAVPLLVAGLAGALATVRLARPQTRTRWGGRASRGCASVALAALAVSEPVRPGAAEVPWLAATLAVAGLGALVWQRTARRDAMPRGLVGAMVAVSVVVGSCRSFAPEAFDQAKIEIRPDIVWMNEQLPARALVLTNETRLFGLQVDIIGVDDPSLQPFYTAPTHEAAKRALHRIGVTHLYISRSGAKPSVFFDRSHGLRGAKTGVAREIRRSSSGQVASINR